jgi:Tfp pilus assembly ATPase PilU
VLRHDPDIIMIGEIRDVETAEIAVQAALTGHLVLSTLHTNNAASSITRLLDMGVQDFLLTSTLSGTVAQRLVRRLCRHCREPYVAMPEVILQLGLRRYSSSPDITLHRPKGCRECHGTGFFGRISIFEILAISDGIRRLILQRAESHELERAAIQEGMRTMYDDGMSKAVAGITTLEEVLQVTRDVFVADDKANRQQESAHNRVALGVSAAADHDSPASARGPRGFLRSTVSGAQNTPGRNPPAKDYAATPVEEILETIEEVMLATKHH